MKSYSQAGQDIFVRLLIPREGTFLDIGCDPGTTNISNTLVLEEEGWSGTLVDITPNAGAGRKARFMCADATKLVWGNTLPARIDYLSLDVDGASFAALKNLPLDRTRFGVITLEHDRYRFGERLRQPERELLRAHGYELVCADVTDAGLPFEDWYVDPEMVSGWQRFKCENKPWQEIIAFPKDA